jgi:sporulation protein YlmC with PRC-barrel domain
MKRIATLLGIGLLTAMPVAAQQPAPSAPSIQSTSPQGVQVGSDSLVGSTVRNPDGRDIGKVSRLMIDPAEGRITAVVIATGGRLGVGGDTVAVPWNAVKVGQDQGKVIVTAQQTLDSAPKADRAKENPPANTSEQRKQ